MQAVGYDGEELSFSVRVPAPEAEAKPQFLSKATRWVGTRAVPSLAAQALEWGAPRGEVRERVESLRAPQAAWWGVVVGGGADGKCRIAETGNFPYSPAFFHAASPSLPPTLPFFISSLTSSVCYGLYPVVESLNYF